MNISGGTLIDKLKREIETISEIENDSKSAYDAMQRIHLLSELWMEAYKDKEPRSNNPPTAEIYSQAINISEDHSINDRVSDEDTSIFDF